MYFRINSYVSWYLARVNIQAVGRLFSQRLRLWNWAQRILIGNNPMDILTTKVEENYKINIQYISCFKMFIHIGFLRATRQVQLHSFLDSW